MPRQEKPSVLFMCLRRKERQAWENQAEHGGSLPLYKTGHASQETGTNRPRGKLHQLGCVSCSLINGNVKMKW